MKSIESNPRESRCLDQISIGVVGVFSGYLIPLQLMPDSMQTAADWLPFKYMLGYSVELITGRYDRRAALELRKAQLRAAPPIHSESASRSDQLVTISSVSTESGEGQLGQVPPHADRP